jgi:hypothetical protein
MAPGSTASIVFALLGSFDYYDPNFPNVTERVIVMADAPPAVPIEVETPTPLSLPTVTP